MISDDLTRISPASLQAVQNTEVIGIDQDPAGLQGTLLSAAGNGQVWVKPLHDGSRAIALLNRGSAAVRLSAGAREAGLPSAASYTVHNVWTHTTYRTSSQIAALVPGDATVLLRVYPN
jgi:alpha-galactosidase